MTNSNTYHKEEVKVNRSSWSSDSTTIDGLDPPNINHASQPVFTVQTYLNHVEGVKNPHWKQQVKAMQNATTPCWGEYVEFPYFSGFAINENYTFVQNGIPEPLGLHSRVNSTSGQAYFPPISTAYDPAFDPVWPRVINRAIAKFISQYNNSRSSIMGGPYIKELGQTLSTIINPMSSIRDLTLGYLGRAEKHGHRYKRDRKSLSKALGDSYLEYGFGLAPFAQDVVNLFVKADSLRLDVKAIDATASERVFASNGAEPYVDTGYVALGAYRNVQKYSRVTVRLKGMIRTGIDKNGQISRAQALRILPQDFLPTVYELIPWSWLLDYSPTLVI